MIIYTDHTQERMVGRLIEKRWVEETIADPDTVRRRKQAIKKIKGEEISVVYVEEGGNLIVITIFWGR